MKKLELTALDLAQRFVGIKETPGEMNNPLVMAMLTLDQSWPTADEVPWCSAFVNYIAWLLRLPRSKSLRARSWLQVGRPITIDEATPGFDVVVLNRGGNPDPDVLESPGHVGFFSGSPLPAPTVYLLGGNQGNGVSVASFPTKDILGVRRLYGD